MRLSLQFGHPDPGVSYVIRPATFGLVFSKGQVACVRVTRDTPYFDLPGGAVDGDETEAEALIREFVEETGMAVRPRDRLVEVGQYFRKSDDSPVNNVGGIWTADLLSIDPSSKVEDDHTLVWLDPHAAVSSLRHDAHAWALTTWLRQY